jgi:hypothetical protein
MRIFLFKIRVPPGHI